MTPLVFAGCVTCLLLGTVAYSWAQKPSVSLHFQSVLVGQEVTLKCFHRGILADTFFWYKQPLGQKPQLMSEFFDYKENGSFVDSFKNDPRFELETDKDRSHLKISNVKMSDSATYYCIGSYSYTFTFLEGYSVHVKDSSSYIQTSVVQSSSKNIHAGDSVTLNCTVHTGSCDGEHRVYWFKDSEDSHPGLIYTHGGRNDQCERKNNTQTHSCVYELNMENLNEYHSGIYYCAVASCGHILFGNGTKLDLTAEVQCHNYLWSGALFFMSLLCVLLAISVCSMTRSHSRKMSGSSGPHTSSMGFVSAEKVYHAVTCANLTNRSQRLRDPTWSECVYHRMKQ